MYPRIVHECIGAAKTFGSCHLMTVELTSNRNVTFLLDCGEPESQEDKTRMEDRLKEIGNELDFCVLSHAHSDHYGLFPFLYSSIPENKIPCFMSDETKDVLELGLKLDKSRNFLDFSHSKPINQVFSHQTKDAKAGVDVIFFEAGHKDGAVITCINIEGILIIYTGDFNDSRAKAYYPCANYVFISNELKTNFGFNKAHYLICNVASLSNDYEEADKIFTRILQRKKPILFVSSEDHKDLIQDLHISLVKNNMVGGQFRIYYGGVQESKYLSESYLPLDVELKYIKSVSPRNFDMNNKSIYPTSLIEQNEQSFLNPQEFKDKINEVKNVGGLYFYFIKGDEETLLNYAESLKVALESDFQIVLVGKILENSIPDLILTSFKSDTEAINKLYKLIQLNGIKATSEVIKTRNHSSINGIQSFIFNFIDKNEDNYICLSHVTQNERVNLFLEELRSKFVRSHPVIRKFNNKDDAKEAIEQHIFLANHELCETRSLKKKYIRVKLNQESLIKLNSLADSKGQEQGIALRDFILEPRAVNVPKSKPYPISLEVISLGSGKEIGRSCYLAKFRMGNKKFTLLVDCGVKPGNWDKPKLEALKYEKLDVVVFTHAHLDHIGAAPILVKEGFITKATRVYMTLPTFFSSILAINGVLRNPKKEDIFHFDEEDVKKFLEIVTLMEYGEVIFDEDVSMHFFNAGHEPGSCMVVINYGGIRVLFTGDFNIDKTTPLIDPASIEEIRDYGKYNLIVSEGTRLWQIGNMNTKSRPDMEKEICDGYKKVFSTLRDKGKVIVIFSIFGDRIAEVPIFRYLFKYDICKGLVSCDKCSNKPCLSEFGDVPNIYVDGISQNYFKIYEKYLCREPYCSKEIKSNILSGIHPFIRNGRDFVVAVPLGMRERILTKHGLFTIFASGTVNNHIDKYLPNLNNQEYYIVLAGPLYDDDIARNIRDPKNKGTTEFVIGDKKIKRDRIIDVSLFHHSSRGFLLKFLNEIKPENICFVHFNYEKHDPSTDPELKSICQNITLGEFKGEFMPLEKDFRIDARRIEYEKIFDLNNNLKNYITFSSEE